METKMRISGLFVIFITGAVAQYSVDQPANYRCTEGDPFQINCTYTGTENSLQWYRQIRDQPPQALLFMYGSGSKSGNGFTMFLDTKSKFTFLYKNTSQTEDSAMYYCAVVAQQFKLIGAKYKFLLQEMFREVSCQNTHGALRMGGVPKTGGVTLVPNKRCKLPQLLHKYFSGAHFCLYSVDVRE
ncbi:hypothetical protein XELAEV_18007250mg [Xenopus laevis]|uniref:Ig-like domain-containing protein n=1 Tax=Xenopus laevis TaxID=8355 RepID=A0A974E0T6_XENLA|nr:hypothetical protein XELAEV_18007250mg [Xenopus laevis]